MSMDSTHDAHPGRAPRISVAMTTYNGGKYILAQLESIAQQDRLPFEIVICDDGSTDNTSEIVTQFRKTAPFPVHFIRNEINLGFAENFLKAARLCSGDWISFCDQDDVWFPNKLSSAVAAIQKNQDAILILQNATLSDTELKTRGRLFPNAIKAGVYGPGRQYGYWVWHGFLQTFQADIIRDVKSTDRPIIYQDGKTYSHDQWTSLIANAIGDIVVLDEPVALYRRHPSAVTGEYRQEKLSERVLNALQISAEYYAFRSTSALSSANYLREAAASCGNSTWRKRLSIAGDEFEKIAAIQKLRAELYSGKNIFFRINSFIRIFISFGYWGPPMIALGTRSITKDLAVVLGFISGSKPRETKEISSDPA